MNTAIVLVLLAALFLFVATTLARIPRNPTAAPPRWIALGVPVAVWLSYLLVISTIIPTGSKLLAFLDALPMSLFMLALVLASTVRIRTGETRRCAACEYDLTGIDPNPEAKCPECGFRFATPGGTVVGQPTWHVGRLALFCLLILPFLASVLLPFVSASSGQSVLSRVLPTNSLIAHVTNARGFTLHQWDILRARSLSPEQHERLALGLLTRTPLSLHAWSDESKWLIAEAAAGRLSGPARTAALGRFLSPSIEPANPPAPTPVVIAADRRQAWGLADVFPNWSFVAILGPVTDAAGQTVRPTATRPLLIDVGPLTAPPPANERTSPGPRLVPDTFPQGLAFTVWFVATPTPLPIGDIAWDQGRPVLPADAVVFSQTFRTSADAPRQ